MRAQAFEACEQVGAMIEAIQDGNQHLRDATSTLVQWGPGWVGCKLLGDLETPRVVHMKEAGEVLERILLLLFGGRRQRESSVAAERSPGAVIPVDVLRLDPLSREEAAE
jgi:hypothetical protein